MKLYIRIGSLFKFQYLYDDSLYLRKVLRLYNANVYLIETDDIEKLKNFLDKEKINYTIK